MLTDKKNYIRFCIQCDTGFGCAVYVKGNVKELSNPIRLDVENDQCW